MSPAHVEREPSQVSTLMSFIRLQTAILSITFMITTGAALVVGYQLRVTPKEVSDQVREVDRKLSILSAQTEVRVTRLEMDLAEVVAVIKRRDQE